MRHHYGRMITVGKVDQGSLWNVIGCKSITRSGPIFQVAETAYFAFHDCHARRCPIRTAAGCRVIWI